MFKTKFITMLFCMGLISSVAMCEAQTEEDCIKAYPGQPSKIKSCVNGLKVSSAVPDENTSVASEGEAVAVAKDLNIDQLGTDAKAFLEEAAKKDASQVSALRYELNKKFGASKMAADMKAQAEQIAMSLHDLTHDKDVGTLAKKFLSVKGIMNNLPYPEKCSYTSTKPGMTKLIERDLETMAQAGLKMKNGIVETFGGNNNWVFTTADSTKSDGVNRFKIPEDVGMTPVPQAKGKEIEQHNAGLLVKVHTPSDSTVTAWVKGDQVICLSTGYKI